MVEYPVDFGNGYKIQTVFANKLPDGSYGDVEDFRLDVERSHPGAEVMVGYCVIDEGIGLIPNRCNDWNNSIPEAIIDYEEHVVPYLEQLDDDLEQVGEDMLPLEEQIQEAKDLRSGKTERVSLASREIPR